jgi:hypothetical protein
MAKKKVQTVILTNDQIRALILTFFYDRASNATSLRGKKGSSVKMKDVKAGLKAAHSLKDNQIIPNLGYLLSQDWIEEEIVEKSFTTPSGVAMPSDTKYYRITAAGTDKIEGPSRFTPKKFDGIKIEATGQNIITIGDGNQINVKYKNLAEALLDLKEALKKRTDLDENVKVDVVSDIETIQGQLAKPTPNKSVVRTLFEAIEKVAAVGGTLELFQRVKDHILPFIN